jgi:DNA-binding GntR family transcriptional regulator
VEEWPELPCFGAPFRGQSSAHVVHAHQRILERIVARDQAGAEAAMRVHLTDARRDLQRQ